MVQKPRWTSSEIIFLKSSYPNLTSSQVAKSLNHSAKAIRNKASRLGVHALERCHSFPRPVKSFSPSPQLAYLIGAILGDGSLCSYDTRYYVSLSVKDLDFVQEVRACIGHVTGKFPKIYKVKQYGKLSAHSHLFRVQLSNKSLFTLLSKPLQDLKAYIEPYPRHFLRGFFDAEGSAWINCRNEPTVKYSNTNKRLLQYVRELLLMFKIIPTPKITKEIYVYINGKKIERPKALYSLCICRKKSVRIFMERIGSSIPRKRLAL